MSSPTEYLTINSVYLNNTDAYWIENLGVLRTTAERRGLVEAMPYTPGGIVYPHRNQFTEIVLVLFIAGASWEELDDNETAIREDVVGDDESILTVPAEWHRNDGTIWTADLLVKGLYEPTLESDDPPVMRYNLPVIIQQGQFTPSGS